MIPMPGALYKYELLNKTIVMVQSRLLLCVFIGMCWLSTHPGPDKALWRIQTLATPEKP